MRKAILTTAAIGLMAFGAALGATKGDAIKNWLSQSAEIYKNRPAAADTAPAADMAQRQDAAPAQQPERADILADTTQTPDAVTVQPAETQATTPDTVEQPAETVMTNATPVDLDKVTSAAGTEAPAEAAPAPQTTASDASATTTTQTDAPIQKPATEFKFDVAAALKDREIGSPDAPVVIEDFSSLACPHCSRFHNEIFPTIKEKYIDTGKVRWIFRSYSLNEMALRAEMLARCAAPGDQYVKMVDMLFKNQVRWAFSDDPMSNLSIIVRIAGVTDDMFLSCVNNAELQAGLLQKYQEYGNKYAIKATPTFVFNNGIKNFSGAGTLDGFVYDIEEILRGAMETKQSEISPEKLDKALEKVTP